MNTIKSLIILLTLLYNTVSFAQNSYIFSGHITDKKGEALIGAHVALHELQKFTQTDRQGDFRIENLPEGEYHVHISFLGYRCVHHQKIQISGKDIHRTYRMQPDNAEMEEIIINADRAYKRRMESSLAVETADEDFIKSNSKGSLMKSLESIPGISAGAIGQGFSKPVIRGLSSNRVALSENGIKQEGQQWGADHGPEIDRFAVERVEIIKGPASLIYGSDAVGGLIRIQPAAVAEKHSSESGLLFIGKSLNNLYGISALNKFRKEDWYYSVRATYTDFGDYKVPADSFFTTALGCP